MSEQIKLGSQNVSAERTYKLTSTNNENEVKAILKDSSVHGMVKCSGDKNYLSSVTNSSGSRELLFVVKDISDNIPDLSRCVTTTTTGNNAEFVQNSVVECVSICDQAIYCSNNLSQGNMTYAITIPPISAQATNNADPIDTSFPSSSPDTISSVRNPNCVSVASVSRLDIAEAADKGGEQSGICKHANVISQSTDIINNTDATFGLLYSSYDKYSVHPQTVQASMTHYSNVVENVANRKNTYLPSNQNADMQNLRYDSTEIEGHGFVVPSVQNQKCVQCQTNLQGNVQDENLRQPTAHSFIFTDSRCQGHGNYQSESQSQNAIQHTCESYIQPASPCKGSSPSEIRGQTYNTIQSLCQGFNNPCQSTSHVQTFRLEVPKLVVISSDLPKSDTANNQHNSLLSSSITVNGSHDNPAVYNNTSSNSVLCTGNRTEHSSNNNQLNGSQSFKAETSGFELDEDIQNNYENAAEGNQINVCSLKSVASKMSQGRYVSEQLITKNIQMEPNPEEIVANTDQTNPILEEYVSNTDQSYFEKRVENKESEQHTKVLKKKTGIAEIEMLNIGTVVDECAGEKTKNNLNDLQLYNLNWKRDGTMKLVDTVLETKKTLLKKVMAIKYCECSASDEGEGIPIEQIYVCDGQIYRLPDANIIRIGRFEFYAFLREDKFYVPVESFFSIVGSKIKNMFENIMKTKSFNYHSLTSFEIQLLVQKQNFSLSEYSRNMIHLVDIQEISHVLLTTCPQNLTVKMLAFSIPCQRVLGSQVSCANCGRTKRDHKKDKAYVQLAQRGEHFSKIGATIGTMNIDHAEFTAFELDGKTYLSFKEITRNKIMSLPVMQERMKKISSRSIIAPKEIEEYLFMNSSVATDTLWIDTITLRCIACMCRLVGRSGLVQQIAKGEFNYSPEYNIICEDTSKIENVFEICPRKLEIVECSRTVEMTNAYLPFIIASSGRRNASKAACSKMGNTTDIDELHKVMKEAVCDNVEETDGHVEEIGSNVGVSCRQGTTEEATTYLNDTVTDICKKMQTTERRILNLRPRMLKKVTKGQHMNDVISNESVGESESKRIKGGIKSLKKKSKGRTILHEHLHSRNEIEILQPNDYIVSDYERFCEKLDRGHIIKLDSSNKVVGLQSEHNQAASALECLNEHDHEAITTENDVHLSGISNSCIDINIEKLEVDGDGDNGSALIKDTDHDKGKLSDEYEETCVSSNEACLDAVEQMQPTGMHEISYECEICGIIITELNCFNEHMNMHMEEQQYQHIMNESPNSQHSASPNQTEAKQLTYDETVINKELVTMYEEVEQETKAVQIVIETKEEFNENLNKTDKNISQEMGIFEENDHVFIDERLKHENTETVNNRETLTAKEKNSESQHSTETVQVEVKKEIDEIEYEELEVESDDRLDQCLEERRKEMEINIKKYMVFLFIKKGRPPGFRVKKFKEGAEHIFPALFLPDPENPETKRARLEFMKAAARYMDDQFKQRRQQLVEQRRQTTTTCINTSDCDVIEPKSRITCYRDEIAERSKTCPGRPGDIDDVYSKVLDTSKDESEAFEISIDIQNKTQNISDHKARDSMYHLEGCEADTEETDPSRREFVNSSLRFASESNQIILNSVETPVSEQTMGEGDNSTCTMYFCNVEAKEVMVDSIHEADVKEHITNSSPNQRTVHSDIVMTDIILNETPIIATCSKYAQSRTKTVKINNTFENEESRNEVKSPKRRAKRKCRKGCKIQDKPTDKLTQNVNEEYTTNAAKLVNKTETENSVERPNRKRCHSSEKQSNNKFMGVEHTSKNRTHFGDTCTSEISNGRADTNHKPTNKPHGTRSMRKGIKVDKKRTASIEHFEKCKKIDGKLRRETMVSITNDQDKCLFDSRTCNIPECYVMLRRVKVLGDAITR